MKVYNFRSNNENTLEDSDQFPLNDRLNQYVKLANFEVKSTQIQSVRFYCTMNTMPQQGIHFETEDENIKQIIINE